MTVRQGKLHTYLGMDLDFSKPQKFSVPMESYLNEAFEEVKEIEIMHGMASMPAADHLFKIHADAGRLDTATTGQFHSLVAQLQW